MRCEEVQEYLADHLAGSLSDRLSGTVHTYVRTHMLSCPECCEELERFEEIQKVLQTIPVEPCDSSAMRARFDLLIGASEKEGPRRRHAIKSPIRPLHVVLVSLTRSLSSPLPFLPHGKPGNGSQEIKQLRMSRYSRPVQSSRQIMRLPKGQPHPYLLPRRERFRPGSV